MAKYPHAENWINSLLDPEKNVSKIEGQTERWTDKQEWLDRIPSAKMGLWSRFWEKNKSRKKLWNYLAWLWAIWKELIQEKIIEST